MKKVFIILFVYLNYFVNSSFAVWPHLESYWVPSNSSDTTEFLKDLIEEFLQVVLALAVFSLIFSWIYFIVSSWSDEKISKARKWIIWSLVWVFLSTLSWWIINWLNNIQIKF